MTWTLDVRAEPYTRPMRPIDWIALVSLGLILGMLAGPFGD